MTLRASWRFWGFLEGFLGASWGLLAAPWGGGGGAPRGLLGAPWAV